jgi:hypothetical protein
MTGSETITAAPQTGNPVAATPAFGGRDQVVSDGYLGCR